jgi:hypothetical protein
MANSKKYVELLDPLVTEQFPTFLIKAINISYFFHISCYDTGSNCTDVELLNNTNFNFTSVYQERGPIKLSTISHVQLEPMFI